MTSSQILRKRYGVNHVSIYKAIYVHQNDPSGQLVERILQGKLSVAAAESMIRQKTPAIKNGRPTPSVKKISEDILKLCESLENLDSDVARLARRSLEKAIEVLKARSVQD